MDNEQVVIVTGASNGIGCEIGKAYVEKGAQVILADIDDQNGRELEGQLSKIGKATFIKTDVRKPEHIQTLIDETFAAFGKIDVLINNAGVSRFKNMFELTLEDWDDVININLRGYFLCAREVARVMKKQDHGGSIVNIASTRAFMSEMNSEAYAASKGGVIALTHALALSLSKYHITANAISPGWIETEDYESLRKIDHQQHPSKRVGRPSDIARACLFLTDPLNDFITGENIIIDGGMTRKMIYEY
ncbi:3-ketoacyl-ACP reductase [Anaerobacillus arseniciselenatis]|uniref:3-ketoacyl-ACP reductase n=1 Tax=Anaerobacillus arseniciselenatis TaxID=85682 RepID=A0A1S2LRL1_9BACI|nr:glucose 1-dehydrogenase [Anaerobacillus arseniciselenatis]OIJ15148.1 3-ketoacyl-ACP reductase [Anaerobacillus arseniciselenatis]